MNIVNEIKADISGNMIMYPRDGTRLSRYLKLILLLSCPKIYSRFILYNMVLQ